MFLYLYELLTRVRRKHIFREQHTQDQLVYTHTTEHHKLKTNWYTHIPQNTTNSRPTGIHTYHRTPQTQDQLVYTHIPQNTTNSRPTGIHTYHRTPQTQDQLVYTHIPQNTTNSRPTGIHTYHRTPQTQDQLVYTHIPQNTTNSRPTGIHTYHRTPQTQDQLVYTHTTEHHKLKTNWYTHIPQNTTNSRPTGIYTHTTEQHTVNHRRSLSLSDEERANYRPKLVLNSTSDASGNSLLPVQSMATTLSCISAIVSQHHKRLIIIARLLSLLLLSEPGQSTRLSVLLNLLKQNLKSTRSTR